MNQQLVEHFESDGILVGWWGYCNSIKRYVFIPRREEDIDEDRRAISALLRRARGSAR